jgi:hypothetical protein
MSDDELAEVAHRSKAQRVSARLSCVLTPEGVWRPDDILAYISWGRTLGFSRFIFRIASALPQSHSKATEFTDYNREAHQPLHNLSAAIESSGFDLRYEQHKSDSHVHVYDFEGAVVDLDESSEEEDPDPKLRRLICMPNGVAYTSWIDPHSNLFPEDAERAEAAAVSEFGAARSDQLRIVATGIASNAWMGSA